MSTITGALDLAEIPEDLFDPSVNLRVAVVYDGSVLGSTELKQGKRKEPVRFAVQFSAPFPGGAQELPCLVRLVIGPDVRDADLLSIDTLNVDVDLTRHAGAAAADAHEQPGARDDYQVAVGVLKATEALYYCWIFCCRSYTIRGRVVCRHWRYDPAARIYRFCDEPVPGATVEAYDVDRLFFWFRRDLIQSALTDINGNFVITFRWCCINWRPWLVKNWAIDPVLFSRVQELLATAGISMPPMPGPDPDPLFLQQLAAEASLAPKRRLLAAPGVVEDALSAEALLGVLPAAPDLAALRVWPWWEGNDCAPDVVFRVTQPCGDNHQVRVIHSETNAQTRWDIPTSLSVTLLANGDACCIPTCRDPECPAASS